MYAKTTETLWFFCSKKTFGFDDWNPCEASLLIEFEFEDNLGASVLYSIEPEKKVENIGLRRSLIQSMRLIYWDWQYIIKLDVIASTLFTFFHDNWYICKGENMEGTKDWLKNIKLPPHPVPFPKKPNHKQRCMWAINYLFCSSQDRFHS